MLSSCDLFFDVNRERLEHLAFKSMKRGLARDEFIAVAIDVDDLNWSELVEILLPNFDWQSIRDRGQKPVARGTIMSNSIVEDLCQACPDIAHALRGDLPPKVVRAVIMTEGSISVYYIEPVPHFIL